MCGFGFQLACGGSRAGSGGSVAVRPATKILACRRASWSQSVVCGSGWASIAPVVMMSAAVMSGWMVRSWRPRVRSCSRRFLSRPRTPTPCCRRRYACVPSRPADMRQSAPGRREPSAADHGGAAEEIRRQRAMHAQARLSELSRPDLRRCRPGNRLQRSAGCVQLPVGGVAASQQGMRQRRVSPPVAGTYPSRT